LKHAVTTLNDKLNLNEEVHEEDIHITHCIPLTSTKRRNGIKYTASIIIKFVRRSIRNKIYAVKKQFAGTSMSTSESLTERRLQILKLAHTKFGMKKTWTMKGSINVSINGKKG